MKSLMSLILVFLFSLTLVSCDKNDRNKIREQFIENVSTGVSDVIAAPGILNCAAPGEIKEDIANQLSKAPFLKPEEVEQLASTANKSAIGSILCEKGIEYVIPLVIGSAIPENWQCENDLISDLSAKLSQKVCDSI